MLDYIKKRAKNNYEEIMKIIKECKTKTDIINRIRQEDVIIDEFKDIINIIKDELKIVIKVDNGITVEKILVFDENYEDYVNLF